MQPNRIQTSAGMETAGETVDRIKAALAAAEQNRAAAGAGTPTTAPQGNPLMDALVARLTAQSNGISTSSSSQLQSMVDEAIVGTQTAGELTRSRLQSEREREIAFAQDRASATYTGALESRTGYATQVVALRELTETTEKEIKDLDKRYQEAIMANDAATAQRVADLQMQKLEFLQAQEQNFFSNLLGVANLQQEAVALERQTEQFWARQQQQESQFVRGLEQSKYEFEQNYAAELQGLDLQRQQLDIQRERNQISWAEYNMKAQQINEQKTRANFEAIIAQDIKNKMATGEFSQEQFLDTNYLSLVAETTGFDGSTEELSSIVRSAYLKVENDGGFVSDVESGSVENVGGLFGQGGPGREFFGGLGVVGSLTSEALFGVPEGQRSTLETLRLGSQPYNPSPSGQVPGFGI